MSAVDSSSYPAADDQQQEPSEPEDGREAVLTRQLPRSKRRLRLQYDSITSEKQRNNALEAVGLELLASFAKAELGSIQVDKTHELLRKFQHAISGYSPKLIFNSWAPPPSLPVRPLAQEDMEISASTTDESSSVEKVLATQGGKYWLSETDNHRSHIQITFNDRVLAGFRFAFPEKGKSASTVEISIALKSKDKQDPDNKKSGRYWVSLGEIDGNRVPQGKSADKVTTIPFIKCCGIKIQCIGFSRDNKQKQHGLHNLSLLMMVENKLSPSADYILAIYDELAKATSFKTGSDERLLELACSHAKQNKSLSSQLSLVQMLLDFPKRISEKSALTLYNYSKHLQKECKSQCVELYSDSRRKRSEFLSDGVFEPHGNVTITNDGKTARNNEAGTVACVNLGIGEGKLIWEIRLDQDEDDSQCTCFGLAIKPLLSTSYDSSAQLWMWRAFNGWLYVKGRSISRRAKPIKVGDTVRFELDMDEGTCRGWVNDDDQGIVFDDLDKETQIFPAVQFYANDRQVSLVSVHRPTRGNAVCYNPPTSSSVSEECILIKDKLEDLPGIPRDVLQTDNEDYFVYVTCKEGTTTAEATWQLPENNDFKAISLTAGIQFETGPHSKLGNDDASTAKKFDELVQQKSQACQQKQREHPNYGAFIIITVLFDSDNVWMSHKFPVPADADDIRRIMISGGQYYDSLPEECAVGVPDGAKSLTLRITSTKPLPYAVKAVVVSPTFDSSLKPVSVFREGEAVKCPLLWCCSPSWHGNLDASKRASQLHELIRMTEKVFSNAEHSVSRIDQTLSNLLKSPHFYVLHIMKVLRLSASELLESRGKKFLDNLLESEGFDMEAPYFLQSTGRGFKVLLWFLNFLVKKGATIFTTEILQNCADSVLMLMNSNLCHLIATGVNPRTVEVEPINDCSSIVVKKDVIKDHDSFEEEFCWCDVNGIIKSLENCASSFESMAKGSEKGLTRTAASCYELIDLWHDISGETPQQRLKWQFSNLSRKNVVVELLFTWPFKGADDHRIDRIILLLQNLTNRLSYRYSLHAAWGEHIVFLVELPCDKRGTGSADIDSDAFAAAYKYLSSGISWALSQAGCGKWCFPFGCDSPNIKIKRKRILSSGSNFQHDDLTKIFVEGGAMFIYSEDVATFDRVDDFRRSQLIVHSPNYYHVHHTESKKTESVLRQSSDDFSDMIPPNDVSFPTSVVDPDEDVDFFADSSDDDA